MHPASPRRSRQKSRGYTLVEVLVVVMILSTAAAVIVPKAMDDSDMQTQSAARCLAGDLEYARDLAITTAQPVKVTFNVAGGSYTLANASTSATLIHPITKLNYVVTFKSQPGMDRVKLQSVSFGAASATQVTFDETGAPDQSGSVRLQAGSQSFQIDVATATGKVIVTAL